MGAWGPGELVAVGLAAPGPQARPAFNPDPFARDLFAEDEPWKAISLWQPWASLVARGVKTYLTLLKPTDYRGPIAIHAARVLDLAGSPDQLCMAALGSNWTNSLPLSAMVAVADLVDVQEGREVERRLTRADRAAGSYGPGRWAWRIENVRPIRKAIPTPGRQGLFTWRAPEDLHDRLGAPLDQAALAHQIGWGHFRGLN